MTALTKKEREAWQQDGFFIRESVFTASELESLRALALEAEQTAQRMSLEGDTYFLDGKRFVDIGALTVQFEHESPVCERVRVIEPVHEIVPRFDELIDDPRLALPMQGLIGQSELSLWTAKLNMKPAKIGSGFGWHQDSPYWVHDCDHVDLLPNVMLTLMRPQKATDVSRSFAAATSGAACLVPTMTPSLAASLRTQAASVKKMLCLW